MAAPVVSDDELLDTDDIQGLVVRAYGRLPAARYLLLRVVDARAARTYLQSVHARINRASTSPETFALQIAFTAQGLDALGVAKPILDTFSREFLEGMDQTDRADALGDRDANDPSGWIWGHEDTQVHAMLMVYALAPLLGTHVAAERAAMAGGFDVVLERETAKLADDKEHFGWRDGLSMPKIAGVPPDPLRESHRTPRDWWTTPIPAGEFVLGYRNDYKVYTEFPTVELVDDPANLLPFAPDGARKSIGRNGTYLVYREMTQDVHAFWSYLQSSSREIGSDPQSRAIALGAKMVGRWPNGAPMVAAPDAEVTAKVDDNDFMYASDRAGTACPHGAHIRRANPRDVLAIEDRSAEASELMVRKHQMVRRGRPFGRALAESMAARDLMAAPRDDVRRGLHFICLVGDINRQFEFVQRAWIHSPTFDSMYRDGDAISAGRRAPGSENPNDEFTCPAVPVRRKYKAVPQFTTLVGGAYFFLPGLRALAYIARHPGPSGGTP